MNIEAQAQRYSARGGPPKQVGDGAPRGGPIPRHQGWIGIRRAHKTARIISDTRGVRRLPRRRVQGDDRSSLGLHIVSRPGDFTSRE